MCPNYRQNPGKEFLLSMECKYQTKVVPFIYGSLWSSWWATGPTLPWYQQNFTPNYGVMMSHWIFWFLLEIIIENWKPSQYWKLKIQRWFSEAVTASWHSNFISRSYGWSVKARFVIFGCSLPHLTIQLLFLLKYCFFSEKSWKRTFRDGRSQMSCKKIAPENFRKSAGILQLH